LLIGKGDGTFSTATVPLPGATGNPAVSALAVADYNGDGNIDLAAAVYLENDVFLFVLLGRGDGTFQSPLVSPLTSYFGLLAADLNGDSIPDLIAWGGGDVYLLGNGDGTFQPGVPFDPSLSPLVVADFSGDGKIDIAGPTFGAIATLLNISKTPSPATIAPRR
jgi:hypothetical protein